MDIYENAVLRKTDVCQILGAINTRTFDRNVKCGRFPQPYQLTPRIPVWRFDEINEFINALPRKTDPLTLEEQTEIIMALNEEFDEDDNEGFQKALLELFPPEKPYNKP